VSDSSLATRIEGALPRVVLGMPVFNGERFIGAALDSILAQDYEHFRLLILDNASTDGTREICREYASRDPRIQCRENPQNLGAAANFRRVFELAEGCEYFKWAACDDLLAPTYLTKAVEILDSDPEAVLCHSNTIHIDCDGRPREEYFDPVDGGSRAVHRRFHSVIWSLDRCFCIFGLMRWSALRMTGLIRRDMGSDRTCLAELSLHGSFRIMPEFLFFRRDNCGQRTGRDRLWWDPANRGRPMLVYWRLAGHHLRAVRGANTSSARKAWLMADVIVRFVAKDGRGLATDVRQAATELLSR
jgi:glycosyltransferase involved in cell wall biosynthesis